MQHKAMIRVRMSTHDAHYGGDLVDGARILQLFGDVATELLVQMDGDEGLFAGYDDIAFKAPVRAGDYLDLPIVKVSLGAEQARAAWGMRANLTAYDAAYAVLAGALDVPLWTRDAKLAAAVGPGFRCHVV